jgi:hypothetical protein
LSQFSPTLKGWKWPGIQQSRGIFNPKSPHIWADQKQIIRLFGEYLANRLLNLGETVNLFGQREEGCLIVSAKRENFVRLAEARVSRALDSIRVIGNLSNRSNYEYDEQDVKKIIKILQDEVAKVKMQLEAKSGVSKQQFKLGK